MRYVATRITSLSIAALDAEVSAAMYKFGYIPCPHCCVWTHGAEQRAEHMAETHPPSPPRTGPYR